MNKSIRDPMEDISLIREILEKTTEGMKNIAPWIMGMGLLWLGYGLFSVICRLIMPSQTMAAVQTAVGWLFHLALAVGFVLCQVRQVKSHPHSIARKMIDLWGICIVLFLVLTFLFSCILPFFGRTMGMSSSVYNEFLITCGTIRSFLFFLLPVLPLFITSVLLEKRGTVLACLVLTLIAAAVLSFHVLMIFSRDLAVSGTWIVFWNGMTCLLDLVPGAMLLILGHQVKRS